MASKPFSAKEKFAFRVGMKAEWSLSVFLTLAEEFHRKTSSEFLIRDSLRKVVVSAPEWAYPFVKGLLRNTAAGSRYRASLARAPSLLFSFPSDWNWPQIRL